MADEVKDDVPTRIDFFNRWRPLVGYTCWGAILINFIIFPLVGLVAAWIHHDLKLPEINIPHLLALIGLTGGTYGVRTIEKYLDIHN